MVSGSGILEQHEGEIRHQFGNVRAQNIGEEFADVVEHRAPFLDGGDDAGEVVVEQNQVGRFLGHVGTAHAHGDADVGGLQRRRVVHAVAGHGDDLALFLQRLDDEHFLLGGDAREDDLRRIQRQLQLRGGHAAHFIANDHHWLICLHQADFACNGARRVRVVAGDHDDADAGATSTQTLHTASLPGNSEKYLCIAD